MTSSGVSTGEGIAATSSRRFQSMLWLHSASP